MKYKLLTGDNIDGLGWTLSDMLKSMGSTVIRCSNSLSALEEGCAEHRPDALIFFVTTVRDRRVCGDVRPERILGCAFVYTSQKHKTSFVHIYKDSLQFGFFDLQSHSYVVLWVYELGRRSFL